MAGTTKAAAKKKADPTVKAKAKAKTARRKPAQGAKEGAEEPPPTPVDVEFWTQALREDWKALCEAPEAVCAMKDLVLIALRGSWRAFELASDELRDDLEVATEAVRGSWWAYAMVGEEAAEDKDLFWLAFNQSKHAAQYAGPGLRADKGVMIKVLEVFGEALEYASEELRSDVEVVGAAVQNYGAAVEFVTDELRDGELHEWMMIQAMKTGVSNLGWAREEFKANHDLMEVCVMHDGAALEHAAPALQSDRGIVLEAVQSDGRALAFASDELKDDFDLVLEAVRHCGEALQYASVELRGEPDLVLEAVKVNGKALAYASADRRATHAIAMAAVEQTWEALRFVTRQGDKLGDNMKLTPEQEVEIASVAVRQDWRAAEALCPSFGCPLGNPPPGKDQIAVIAAANPRILQVAELRDNEAAVRGAVAVCGKSLQHASSRLRADFEVVEIALRSDPDAILYASAGLKADHEMRPLSLRCRLPKGKLKKPGKERERAYIKGVKGGWFAPLPGMVVDDLESDDTDDAESVVAGGSGSEEVAEDAEEEEEEHHESRGLAASGFSPRGASLPASRQPQRPPREESPDSIPLLVGARHG